MGLYLSTDITSPQIVVAGGQLTGNLVFTAPAPGYYYLVAEQYTGELVFVPGSRSFLRQAVAGGTFTNSTIGYTVLAPVVTGEETTIPVLLTLPYTDNYLYMFLKRISTIIPAGSFIVGNTYKILSIGTTDFTLIGAVTNTVGLEFIATGIGVGTGTACVTPDPNTDDTIDYVVVTIQSAAPSVGGINMGELMNLMITMMIVVMMMKMMTGAMQST